MWLARSEVLKAWVFLVNTTLAMIIALLVKDGEIPLMSQLPLFHTVRHFTGLPGMHCCFGAAAGDLSAAPA